MEITDKLIDYCIFIADVASIQLRTRRIIFFFIFFFFKAVSEYHSLLHFPMDAKLQFKVHAQQCTCVDIDAVLGSRRKLTVLQGRVSSSAVGYSL